MTDEELFKALSQTARARSVADDSRLDALAEGALTDDERRELLSWSERSPENRAAYEAFRPIDAEVIDAMADRFARDLGSPSVPASPARPVALQGWRRRGAVAFAACALAAGVALAARFGTGRPPPVEGPLPTYELSLAGGERAERGQGTPDLTARVGPTGRLEITLRPAEDVVGPIGVRAFLVRDGRAREWDVRTDRGEGGVFRISGDRTALFHDLPSGRWEMVFLVGRPSALSRRSAAGLEEPRQAPSGDVLVLRRSVVLIEDPR